MAERGAWTVEEANAALPEVRTLLAQARTHMADLREVEAHLEDLRIVWGDAVLAVACPGHAEFARYYATFTDTRAKFQAVLLRFHALGIEVKEVEQGLVDFRGTVAAAPAYLCWKDGEERVAHWHPLEGGFAARRPLPPK
ncbi:MAG: DUF2203 domain-containing protein [Candidatus Thermoplasmatota archaeon]